MLQTCKIAQAFQPWSILDSAASGPASPSCSVIPIAFWSTEACYRARYRNKTSSCTKAANDIQWQCVLRSSHCLDIPPALPSHSLGLPGATLALGHGLPRVATGCHGLPRVATGRKWQGNWGRDSASASFWLPVASANDPMPTVQIHRQPRGTSRACDTSSMIQYDSCHCLSLFIYFSNSKVKGFLKRIKTLLQVGLKLFSPAGLWIWCVNCSCWLRQVGFNMFQLWF